LYYKISAEVIYKKEKRKMRSAIMDIGYNAIRAVVYENDDIGAPEIFNSKFKNDILTLLANEDFDIKHQTYLSIQYLLHIFRQLSVTNIKCVATAVLREHERADEFIEFIKNKYNFEIEIISGENEARLTALGLITGIKHSDGIAADLGGGSLELVEVSDTKIGELKSLELGTKVITSRNLEDQESITNIIKEYYANHDYNNLYFIGGALRFIGRLYIDFMNYPMKNLHNLEISTDDFQNYLEKLQSASESTKAKLGKRKVNKNAIFVAKAMIEVFKPKNIIISTYGLKEGVRIESLGKDALDQDIVFEKVKYNCDYKNENTNFDSYFAIISNLVSSENELYVVLQLSIMLFKLKHKFDKTLNPTALSEFILSSEIPFTHKNRIKLALILAYSSNFKPHTELIKISKRIVSKEEHNDCQIIGNFLCIAEQIDGPVFTEPTFSIKIQNHFLEIISKEILPRPIFEKICNRLKSIAYSRKMNSN
jgi:exopolyphosphatase / guanosine-5'-triphosphate,3'-diphosphate pyrophosphatase